MFNKPNFLKISRFFSKNQYLKRSPVQFKRQVCSLPFVLLYLCKNNSKTCRISMWAPPKARSGRNLSIMSFVIRWRNGNSHHKRYGRNELHSNLRWLPVLIWRIPSLTRIKNCRPNILSNKTYFFIISRYRSVLCRRVYLLVDLSQQFES